MVEIVVAVDVDVAVDTVLVTPRQLHAEESVGPGLYLDRQDGFLGEVLRRSTFASALCIDASRFFVLPKIGGTQAVGVTVAVDVCVETTVVVVTDLTVVVLEHM